MAHHAEKPHLGAILAANGGQVNTESRRHDFERKNISAACEPAPLLAEALGRSLNPLPE